ncbi:uncharacterized protein LOC126561987 [Anopheles maculipalpis]|uniref:uncharacterized protein LOC126561987 n=1 Tax=Anopheles maculipalpis TaxID=1496333 RepID=UPI0021594EB3|nr:uncharacterized protein LOC126561987 [Anopheles maculipalpis]
MPFSCCSATFCKNNRYNVNRRGLDITFHTFPPLQYPLTKQWITFCKREESWVPHKHSVLCSAHFREDDFQMVNSPMIKQGKRIRHLNALAVPTIINRTPITVSTREKLDNVRKQLLEKLYSVDDDNLDNEPPTGTDHTYSEAKVVKETKKKGPLAGCRKSIFFLQRFPNVCAFCLRIIQDPNFFIPVTHYQEELECTIEQKFDELTGDPMSQEDRSDVHHLLPDKVCNECVTMIVKFHQYQRQLECIKKFTTGIAHLLYGNGKPLETLYQDQGAYLVNMLKHLDTAQGTRVNQSLEQLLEEVTSYGSVKRNSLGATTTCKQIPEDGMSIELCSSPTGQTVLPNIIYDGLQSVSPTPSSQSLQAGGQGMIEDGTDDKNRSKQLYTCPYLYICKQWFISHAAMQQHVREEHKTFICHVCGFKIAFYDLYKKHMESHSIARALLLSHNKQSASLETECHDNLVAQAHQSTNTAQRPKRPKKNDVSGNYVCGVCLGVFVKDHEFSTHQCTSSDTSIATPKDILIGSNSKRETNDQNVVSSGWDDSRATTTTNKSSKSIGLLQIEFL